MIWLAALIACQSEPYPMAIPGTTYRITEDVPAKGSEVRVDLLTSRADCLEAGVEDLQACLPFADRANGQVHLSFLIRDPVSQTLIPRQLSKEDIRVTHDKATIEDDYELIPHEPMSSGQLYILLIDGSGSMYENDGERIKKVEKALLAPKVADAFYRYPRSGVVLVRFTDRVVGLDGGPPVVLRTKQAYRDMVKGHLTKKSGGYTHLYDAVKYGVTKLIDDPEIAAFASSRGASPTLVLLTDGFNNEAADDTCGTNAARLQSALEVLKEVRRERGVTVRPTVFTAGLGVGVHGKEMRKRRNRNSTPNAGNLCGKFSDRRIDGDLETFGIDNVSLEWIAEAGGGVAFVKDRAEGLAQVFQETAGERYRWFEVNAKVDSAYHRRSFEMEFQLRNFDQAVSTVALHPNAWMDAPTGVPREEGSEWVVRRPFLASLALLLPTLGFLIFLNYFGAAWFNARRAIFRRGKPRGKSD